ncbi:MAG: hypothetical protein LBF22_04890 [Deltaproteobacteria bacterium]|jgi:hypothetical protein|nr:hypothetical protein [Deltaproteobacteria bacterium]
MSKSNDPKEPFYHFRIVVGPKKGHRAELGGVFEDLDENQTDNEIQNEAYDQDGDEMSDLMSQDNPLAGLEPLDLMQMLGEELRNLTDFEDQRLGSDERILALNAALRLPEDEE